MADKLEILKTSEIRNGEMKAVTVSNREMLIARVDDQFYAADAHCPHMGGKLASGKLEGTVVICPLHGSRFDLKDGRVVLWTNWSGLFSKLSRTLKSPRQLQVYPLIVEGDAVFMER